MSAASRAQRISRYGWRAVVWDRMPSDDNPFPRLRIWRWWP